MLTRTRVSRGESNNGHTAIHDYLARRLWHTKYWRSNHDSYWRDFSCVHFDGLGLGSTRTRQSRSFEFEHRRNHSVEHRLCTLILKACGHCLLGQQFFLDVADCSFLHDQPIAPSHFDSANGRSTRPHLPRNAQHVGGQATVDPSYIWQGFESECLSCIRQTDKAGTCTLQHTMPSLEEKARRERQRRANRIRGRRLSL